MDGAAFMSSRGLVHFDSHFANVLTDGHQLYFADFGLALSSRFDLSAAESTFLADHLTYDRCYTGSHLLRYHVLDGVRGDADRDVFLRAWVAGRRPRDVPPEIAATIDRHARAAVVLESFFHRFLTKSKQTRFPAAEIEGEWATSPS